MRAYFGAGAGLGMLCAWLAVGCSNPPQEAPVPRATTRPPAAAAGEVAPGGGWRPQEACAYLADVPGLRTNTYKSLYEADFGCFSRYKSLDGEGAALPNNLAYYVEGDARRALRLKLVLNVNVPAQGRAALAELRHSGEALAVRALGQPLPVDVGRALAEGRAGEWVVGQTQVQIRRDVWPTGKGYGVHYVLQRAPE